MNPSRRTLLAGGAALGAAAALSPERLWAAAAQGRADWSLALQDLETDLAPRAMRLVQGRAPAQLSGALYRNGPAKFRRGGEVAHWFDGDGLVRAFRIGEGRAELAARFVDTPKRRNDAAAGSIVTPGFGTRGSSKARLGRTDDANAANTAMLSVGATVATATGDGAPTTTVSPKDAGVMLVLADYETNVRLTFDRGNGGTWSVVYPLAYVSEWSQETADINEVGFACTIVPVQTAEQSDDEAPFYYEITGPDITV